VRSRAAVEWQMCCTSSTTSWKKEVQVLGIRLSVRREGILDVVLLEEVDEFKLRCYGCNRDLTCWRREIDLFDGWGRGIFGAYVEYIVSRMKRWNSGPPSCWT
jgi:hypothetical protein